MPHNIDIYISNTWVSDIATRHEALHDAWNLVRNLGLPKSMARALSGVV